MAVIERKYQIKHIDTGMDLKMSNRAFLSYLEDIASFHGNTIGASALNIEETRLTWIIMGWHVEIYQRPKFLDEITIRTWSTGSYKKIYSFRDFEVFNSNGDLIAKASSKWILYNIDKQMPIRIPEELAEKFKPENSYVFGKQDVCTLKENQHKGEITYVHNVQKRDIDVNMHVHNVFYLDFANEALPMEVYKNVAFDKFDIIYKKQFVYGEKITCRLLSENDSSFVTLLDDDNITHAYLKLYN